MMLDKSDRGRVVCKPRYQVAEMQESTIMEDKSGVLAIEAVLMRATQSGGEVSVTFPLFNVAVDKL